MTTINYRKYSLDDKIIIYFAQVPSSQIKIGITGETSLKIRLGSLQSGNHQEIKIIRSISGIIQQEQWLHERYKRKGLHIRGEWFEYDEEMLTIIPPQTLKDLEDINYNKKEIIQRIYIEQRELNRNKKSLDDLSKRLYQMYKLIALRVRHPDLSLEELKMEFKFMFH